MMDKSIALNKWGKKVIFRFFGLDSRMNISPLINKLVITLGKRLYFSMCICTFLLLFLYLVL